MLWLGVVYALQQRALALDQWPQSETAPVSGVLDAVGGSAIQLAFACQLRVGRSNLDVGEIGAVPRAGLSEVLRGLARAEPGRLNIDPASGIAAR